MKNRVLFLVPLLASTAWGQLPASHCLCGTVQVVEGGDVVVDPISLGLDDNYQVELHDVSGKKLEARNVNFPFPKISDLGPQRDNPYDLFSAFCFAKHPSGKYVLRVALFRNNKEHYSTTFPLQYISDNREPRCRGAVYLIPREKVLGK